jgi:hypothetical protein
MDSSLITTFQRVREKRVVSGTTNIFPYFARLFSGNS